MHRDALEKHVSSESSERRRRNVLPEERELNEELRRFREASGLSLQALAHGTGYSKASWHRVFSQGAFPPREAVEGLCARRKLDASRLLTLWDRAREARVQRAAGTLEPDVSEEALPAGQGEEEHPLSEAGQEVSDPAPRGTAAGDMAAGSDAAVAEPPPQHAAPTSGSVSPVERISADRAAYTASRYGGGRFLVLLTACLILFSTGGWYLLHETAVSPPAERAAPPHTKSPRSALPPTRPQETPTSSASRTATAPAREQPSGEHPARTAPPTSTTKSTPATGEPGAQQGCSGKGSISNIDAGYGRLTGAGNMKTGPYSVCSNVRAVTPGTVAYYWCSVTNSHGHSWTYTRIKEQQWQGWLSGDTLDDGGSTKPCPTTTRSGTS
jgi:hypothetical protein